MEALESTRPPRRSVVLASFQGGKLSRWDSLDKIRVTSRPGTNPYPWRTADTETAYPRSTSSTCRNRSSRKTWPVRAITELLSNKSQSTLNRKAVLGVWTDVRVQIRTCFQRRRCLPRSKSRGSWSRNWRRYKPNKQLSWIGKTLNWRMRTKYTATQWPNSSMKRGRPKPSRTGSRSSGKRRMQSKRCSQAITLHSNRSQKTSSWILLRRALQGTNNTPSSLIMRRKGPRDHNFWPTPAETTRERRTLIKSRATCLASHLQHSDNKYPPSVRNLSKHQAVWTIHRSQKWPSEALSCKSRLPLLTREISRSCRATSQKERIRTGCASGKKMPEVTFWRASPWPTSTTSTTKVPKRNRWGSLTAAGVAPAKALLLAAVRGKTRAIGRGLSTLTASTQIGTAEPSASVGAEKTVDTVTRCASGSTEGRTRRSSRRGWKQSKKRTRS